MRERDVVEVVEGVDGGAQTLVVLLLDQQRVQRLVDCLVVVVLHRAQVRLHQRDVARLSTNSRNTTLKYVTLEHTKTPKTRKVAKE